MKALRADLSPDDRDNAAIKVANHAAALFQSGKIIAVYHPLGGELNPAPLADAARAAGCVVCLPRVAAQNAPLSFHRWDERDQLVSGAFGVMEPSMTAQKVVPDLILLPLLAADRTGGRLGYGGGFYDRTIAGLRDRGADVTALGLAYDGQIVENVPTDELDQRLDGLLTPSGLVMFG